MNALFSYPVEFFSCALQIFADISLAKAGRLREIFIGAVGVKVPAAFKVGGFIQPEALGQQFIFAVIKMRSHGFRAPDIEFAFLAFRIRIQC